MAKHYIRLKDGFIIKGLSDAFTTPIQGDICINPEGQRHFEYNGVTNKTLLDSKGFCRYKYSDGQITPATREEQEGHTKYYNRQQEELRKKDYNNNGEFSNLTMDAAAAYIDKEVVDLPSAKRILKILVRLILART